MIECLTGVKLYKKINSGRNFNFGVMGKYFQVSKEITRLSKEEVIEIQKEQEQSFKEFDRQRIERQQRTIAEQCSLKHVEGRVIVVVNTQIKNFHTFSHGETIRLERAYNNFNRRQTEPVNAFVISSEDIPKGSEILIHHNALHETNRITDFKPLSGEQSGDIKYYSLTLDDCFAWRGNKVEWKPLTNFEFGLRVFRPYQGTLHGIEPALIKDALYVTTGNLKGSVVNTLKAADYQVVFQGDDGREKNLIRFRHSEDENFVREEVVCINHEMTEQVNEGNLLIGIEVKNAKQLEYERIY